MALEESVTALELRAAARCRRGMVREKPSGAAGWGWDPSPLFTLGGNAQVPLRKEEDSECNDPPGLLSQSLYLKEPGT